MIVLKYNHVKLVRFFFGSSKCISNIHHTELNTNFCAARQEIDVESDRSLPRLIGEESKFSP